MTKFTTSIKERIVGLDELRGIAILLVMFDHGIFLWLNMHPYVDIAGPLGVNIFFIISGYLICTILKNTPRERGFFRNFYIRRAFRILPLFGVITILGLLASIAARKPYWIALPYYLTFSMNFAVVKMEKMFILGQDGSNWVLPFTSPTWSLAVEEQFYLFLPLLVFLIHPKRLSYVVMILCLICAICSLNYTQSNFGENAILAWPNPKDTILRIHFIGFGVLLALQPRLAYAATTLWFLTSAIFFNFAGTIEISSTIMLIWIIHRTISKAPLIRNRFLARAGIICYGLYLLHYPIARIIQEYLIPHVNQSLGLVLLVFIAFLGISFGLAQCSFVYFENPIQKLRSKYEI